MEVTQEQYDSTLERIDYLFSNDDQNIELETSFNPEVQKKKIDRHLFEKIISRLKGLDYLEEIHEEQLDIRCDGSNIRMSITNLDDITQYCNSNEISNMDLEFIKKTRIDEFTKSLDINEYGIRINMKNEEILDNTDKEVETLIMNQKTKKKSFRLKKRISFTTPDNLFRYDLTVLKESDKNPDGSYKLSSSLLNSNVLRL